MKCSKQWSSGWGEILLVWTGGFNDCHERYLITASIVYPCIAFPIILNVTIPETN
jgi:hypothetical protein